MLYSIIIQPFALNGLHYTIQSISPRPARRLARDDSLAYPRYIKRKGKVYGPYYYKSVRDKSGNVMSVYVGREAAGKRFTLQKFRPGRRMGMVVAIAFLFLAVSLIPFFGTRMTGFLAYSPNQRINETLLMEIGKPVPAESFVYVQMENQSFNTQATSYIHLPPENITWENETMEGYFIGTLEINIDSFIAPDAEGNYTIIASLVYNGTEIANASKEITVGPEITPEIPGNIENVTEAQINQTIAENQTIQANLTEPASSEVVQGQAEINKPV